VQPSPGLTRKRVTFTVNVAVEIQTTAIMPVES
jgi:hypothetical protein